MRTSAKTMSMLLPKTLVRSTAWTNDQSVEYVRADGSKFTAATAQYNLIYFRLTSSQACSINQLQRIASMPKEQVISVLGDMVLNTSASWSPTRTMRAWSTWESRPALCRTKATAFAGLSSGENVSNVFQALSAGYFGSGSYDG